MAMLFPPAEAAVNITVESFALDGVKYMSLVTMFTSLPASINLSCWSSPSKRVTPSFPFLSLKPFMTAFSTVAPLELNVNSNFLFPSVTLLACPLRTSWKAAVVSAAACAFAAASVFAFAAACALFLSTVAMESCVRCCAISASEGLLYQLKPISKAAMRTKPVIVFLSIS